MGSSDMKNNGVLAFLLERSLLTSKQFEMISKRMGGEPAARQVSRGAYYRLLKQSREKVEAVLYSVLLLESTGFIDASKKDALERLSRQLVVVMRSGDVDAGTARDVMRIMDEVLRRLSKV